MRVTIDVNITRATTKRLLILGAALTVGLTVAVVHAALAVPTFKTGDTLQAASLTQLSAGVTDLDARLTALENRPKAIGGFVTCAPSGCTVPFEYPTGLLVSAVRTSVGSYTLIFPTTYNGTINACTITSENAGGVPVTLQGSGDNQLKVTLFAVGNTGPTEGNFTFTCVGAFP
jgi:hypothetical protein